jgi:hypothetical protein
MKNKMDNSLKSLVNFLTIMGIGFIAFLLFSNFKLDMSNIIDFKSLLNTNAKNNVAKKTSQKKKIPQIHK